MIILTLAIGIGVNAAVFSVLQAVMLRSLPYCDRKQLVLLADPTDRANGGFLLKDFDRLQEQARSFQALAIYYRDAANANVEELVNVVGRTVCREFQQSSTDCVP